MRRLILLAALLAAAGASAQTPAADWRTVTTPHFRIHYPSEYSAWALRVAEHIESIRTAVATEAGFEAPQITDVIICNPDAVANGMTLPLLDSPRLVLYAEAPEPDSQIGEFGDWTDLLVVHEMAHLEHLLRPSRNPLSRAAAALLPVGPIALRAPRWVTEGYATVVEGRLTGEGRPSSSIRAAILRKWAESGRLPTYAQLASDRRFLGMSMAYLAGSAYLEWLEERSGPGSLRKLWARMTARQQRPFAQAFEGVFGDAPDRLYARFAATLTERAVALDTAGLVEGQLWQETAGNTGDPAVSPDGKQIAVVTRNDKGESKLVVWSTAPETEEEKKFAERVARILKRDPEDVAPVRVKPLPRKPVRSFRFPLAGPISSPRWMPDAESILFEHRARDRNGDRHHDLYLWGPKGLRRVTRQGDVYDADPLPDGRTAVAVRSRHGFSQLVSVDLGSGSVTPITEPALDSVYSHPRVNGERIAYAVHRRSAWRLAVRDLASGRESEIPTTGSAASPEWSRTAHDEIYATLLGVGSIDIHRLTTTGGDETVTRMSGGAFQPAPSPDGRLFFMALEPDGYTVRVLDAPAPLSARSLPERSFVPALPPPHGTPVSFAAQQLPAPRPYGIGRQELGLLVSGNAAPSAHTTEIGIRSGDVVGRLDAIAVAAVGDRRSQRGGTIAAAWRGLPVELRGQLFTSKEPWRACASPPDDVAGCGRDATLKQNGFELRGVWRALSDTTELTVESGGLARNAASLGFVAARGAARQRFTSEALEVAGESGRASHVRARLSLLARAGPVRFGASAQRDDARNVSGPFDSVTVGGLATTILPRSAFANRVLDPALETATLEGRRYEGGQIDATVGGLTFFRREHRLGRTIAMNGVEVMLRIPPTPLIKIPSLALTAGGARVLSRNRWWVGVRIEP